MKTPNFANGQFVAASGVGSFDSAFALMSQSIGQNTVGSLPLAGLISPEYITIGFAGLVATVGVPLPAGVMLPSGGIVNAHGTQDGADTQTYTVDFSSVVPGSGSVTAYLVAASGSVMQTPVPIPGPPPGHPSYDPFFVPTVSYADRVDTLVLSATTTPPDNATSFEIGRTTLNAGQTSISALNISHQFRAAAYWGRPPNLIGASTILPPQAALTSNMITASGVVSTLPDVAACAGLTIPFVMAFAPGGAATIQRAGSAQIYGYTVGAATSIAVSGGNSVGLFSDGNNWFVVLSSPIPPPPAPTITRLPDATTLDFGGNVPVTSGTYTMCGNMATSGQFQSMAVSVGTVTGTSYVVTQALNGTPIPGLSSITVSGASRAIVTPSSGAGLFVPGDIWTLSISAVSGVPRNAYLTTITQPSG